MFHLSLPVRCLAECVRFYRQCFDAEAVALAPGTVNLFVFGGQSTLHERPKSALTEAARGAMHFGAVLPREEWLIARGRLAEHGIALVKLVEPAGPGGRGKLVVSDPSGNLVELNAHA